MTRVSVGVGVLVAGLLALVTGLLPPGLLLTGQLSLWDWLLPVGIAAVVMPLLLRMTTGRIRPVPLISALGAVCLPPLLLFATGSVGGAERFAIAFQSSPVLSGSGEGRAVGILSGPVLHAPLPGGGFPTRPLWRALSAIFPLQPIDALETGVPDGLRALLLIQPRTLSPQELIALDTWVRDGGRAVLLTDPDLRWADERPLGHPLRAPPASMLGPLLSHWGLVLAPAAARGPGDPVDRRNLGDGRMIQIAGNSRFSVTNRDCAVSDGGLVARCWIGRGTAILVADADFANDSLWTAAPDSPRRTDRWTSDSVAVIAEWLSPGAGVAAGRRVWLARADGLAPAIRPALILLVLLALAAGLAARGPGMTAGRREAALG
ncbi:MAG: DUF4350 domain-containing protein [Sphingobium sp.]